MTVRRRSLIPIPLSRAPIGARLTAPALVLLLAGCAGGGSAPGAAPAPDPSLGVSLEAMRRTDSGLYIRTVEPGDGPAIRPGQVAVVHYTGWLTDGTKFDSSLDRNEPLRIPIGAGRVIAGWDEGIPGMRVGERRRLVVPPDLGYGARGAPGAIPPNATLLFEIQLLDIR